MMREVQIAPTARLGLRMIGALMLVKTKGNKRLSHEWRQISSDDPPFVGTPPQLAQKLQQSIAFNTGRKRHREYAVVLFYRDKQIEMVWGSVLNKWTRLSAPGWERLLTRDDCAAFLKRMALAALHGSTEPFRIQVYEDGYVPPTSVFVKRPRRRKKGGAQQSRRRVR